MGCIMRPREGSRSQGSRTQGEQSNETCDQDVDPDGRFGLHVRGGCHSDASRKGWRTDPVMQSQERLRAGRLRPPPSLSRFKRLWIFVGLTVCERHGQPSFYWGSSVIGAVPGKFFQLLANAGRRRRARSSGSEIGGWQENPEQITATVFSS